MANITASAVCMGSGQTLNFLNQTEEAERKQDKM